MGDWQRPEVRLTKKRPVLGQRNIIYRYPLTSHFLIIIVSCGIYFSADIYENLFNYHQHYIDLAEAPTLKDKKL